MDPFDDLRKRDRSHAIEEKAETAFRRRLVESRALNLQGVDRKDYASTNASSSLSGEGLNRPDPKCGPLKICETSERSPCRA